MQEQDRRHEKWQLTWIDADNGGMPIGSPAICDTRDRGLAVPALCARSNCYTIVVVGGRVLWKRALTYRACIC